MLVLRRSLFLFAAALCSSVAFAAIEIPKASGKALGVTRGRPFSKGLVFVDGRYIEPPYVVERWGNGIRINKIPVISQVIDWSEFVKTQDGAKVIKTESAPVADAPASESEAEPAAEEPADFESSLDDLFDDEPRPKKAEKKSVKKTTVRKSLPAKPVTTVSYALDGEFAMNDAARTLVKKINKVRTDINAILLAEGFVCFGERYSRVSGDVRTADQILELLPDLQRGCESEAAMVAGARSAGLVYLTEPVCRDLYRNRRDYLKLKVRRDKVKSDRALDRFLNGAKEKPRY